MILLTCLIVITLGALVGTTILYFSGAQRTSAEVAFRGVQARAMAWSGVQAAMAELSAKRESLLRGEPVTITQTWTAEVDEAARPKSHVRWGYRVHRVRNTSLEAEMGKLDVNSATAEMLVKLDGISKELAAAIVSARKSRRFASVPELLAVKGMTAELLFGKPAPGASTTDASEDGNGAGGAGATGSGASGATSESASAPPGDGSDRSGSTAGASERANATGAEAGALPRQRRLADYLTVFSFDPEVQIGFGSKASEVAGNQRINLNAVWSDALGEAIEKRFDKGVADGVKGLMERGEKFGKPSDIVKKLRAFSIEPKDWVEVLDAFTTSPDEYRLGMIDLSTASVEVLACVPGITKDAAKEIAFRRERLDEDRKLTVAWPVLEGLLTPDEFEKAVDHLTTRCMQWKVVIEGGALPELTGSVQDVANESGESQATELDGDSDDSLDGESGDVGAGTTISAASVMDRVVLEAVIDVAGRRPRIAMLRDVTHLPLATKLASISRRANDTVIPQDEPAESANASAPASASGSSHDLAHHDLSGHDLDMPDLSPSDLSLGFDDEGGDTSGPLDVEPDRASGSSSSGGMNDPAPEAGRDRRLGRWSTGATGGPQ